MCMNRAYEYAAFILFITYSIQTIITGIVYLVLYLKYYHIKRNKSYMVTLIKERHNGRVARRWPRKQLIHKAAS